MFSSVLGIGYIKPAPGTFGSLIGCFFWWLLCHSAWSTAQRSVSAQSLNALAPHLSSSVVILREVAESLNKHLFAVELFAVVFIIIASIFFSSLAEKIHQKTDDGRIVIDEVAGMWVSLFLLPPDLLFFMLAFVLFRFFDVKKPLFINKLQSLKSGWGITLDDVAAGICVNIILQILALIMGRSLIC